MNAHSSNWVISQIIEFYSKASRIFFSLDICNTLYGRVGEKSVTNLDG